MKTTEAIIGYLTKTYDPDAVILYGSFADGSAAADSDFDALVIADGLKKHDASVIGNTALDVFVYPPETFLSDYDPEKFVQIYDGNILLDASGLASQLKKRVRDYIENKPPKTPEELRQEIGWCEKMTRRTLRVDTEGYYRWHWLLTDSLEIYYDLKRMYYFGPKKALRQMERSDSEAFSLYSKALKEFDRDSLSEWTEYLKKLFEKTQTGIDGGRKQ
ncbi:MAG: nucleotidyltransferase domain-containing protein [Clostridia bacterium]|nr:nucleotidyltransferase domain-containing protein [Clostridia bacterium]